MHSTWYKVSQTYACANQGVLNFEYIKDHMLPLVISILWVSFLHHTLIIQEIVARVNLLTKSAFIGFEEKFHYFKKLYNVSVVFGYLAYLNAK